MKSKHKLLLVILALLILNICMGFDLRFTIINLVWCIPIFYDWIKEIKKHE